MIFFLDANTPFLKLKNIYNQTNGLFQIIFVKDKLLRLMRN